MTLFGKILLSVIVIFFGLAIYFNRKKNFKSSVVYIPTLTTSIYKKINLIKKKYSCLERVKLNEAGTLFRVEFFGNNRKFKAADELDCYLNRRFNGGEKHRV